MDLGVVIKPPMLIKARVHMDMVLEHSAVLHVSSLEKVSMDGPWFGIDSTCEYHLLPYPLLDRPGLTTPDLCPSRPGWSTCFCEYSGRESLVAKGEIGMSQYLMPIRWPLCVARRSTQPMTGCQVGVSDL